MSLESKSQELKDIVATYDTAWFLGNLSDLMKHIASGRAEDQIGKLSSPMRQLFFLGGLLVTSEEISSGDKFHSDDKWERIIELLNEIEIEYHKLFFPQPDEEIDEEWKRVRSVAMPSFLSYFNQGPLNFEEQTINWVQDLYSQLDEIVQEETDLSTEDFVLFYSNLDTFVQKNFQSFSTQPENLKNNWEDYARIEVAPADHMPEIMNDLFEERKPLITFMADHGIINRFKPEDISSEALPIEKVNIIINLLSCKRESSDFLYYTSTKPGNPLYENPITDIGDGYFQVFEIKQVIHAIDNLLETICSKTEESTTKLVDKKGKLLEKNIVDLFKKFFKKDYVCYTSYYVDGCEQDILFLWKNYAFIIEAKGYNMREPFRDPNRAFVRIKDDFKSCIGYGYKQTHRVEKKFVEQVPLKITDKDGDLIEEIDTKKYENNDFSIIVNLKSFGQIQNDLNTLLDVKDDDAFPWAVRYDDLEVFLLTLIAQKKKPDFFIDFLLLRENLHGKLVCFDELEVCGGFLKKIVNDEILKKDLIATTPDLADIFDEQYRKGIGFKNEKYLADKKSGKTIFW